MSRHRILFKALLALALLSPTWGQSAFGAEVVGCSLTNSEMQSLEDYGESFLKKRTRRCLVRMMHGKIGDEITFNGLSGYIKAKGRIIAKNGPYYSIKLTEVNRNIHHSDIVTLGNYSDQHYWAAVRLPN